MPVIVPFMVAMGVIIVIAMGVTVVAVIMSVIGVRMMIIASTQHLAIRHYFTATDRHRDGHCSTTCHQFVFHNCYQSIANI